MVAAHLSSDRPPSLHALRHRFVVGFVRGFPGTTQPSDSSHLPRQLRLLDFLSWPAVPVATAGGVRSPRFRRVPFVRDVALDPGDGSSHIGTAHVAFGSRDGLGPCNFRYFVAQSHTPHDHCVRFAAVVTSHDATLVSRPALPLTWAGLSPAGPRQLRLAHHDSPHLIRPARKRLRTAVAPVACERSAASAAPATVRAWWA